jgi:hypothetical protein
MISHISGAITTLAGAFIAVTVLARMRSPRARRVLSQTTGSQFRLSLAVVAGGLFVLLAGWVNFTTLVAAVVLAWAAIVIWDRSVWFSNRRRQPS